MRIESIDDPSEALREAIQSELRRHNQAAAPDCWAKLDDPDFDARPLNLFAFDSDGAPVGGLFAATRFAWLKIALMATLSTHRRQGIGRLLLARAEAIAHGRGCRHAYVDTMEHQAPGFYAAAGYRLAGTLPDWDSHGRAKHFFIKDL